MELSCRPSATTARYTNNGQIVGTTFNPPTNSNEALLWEGGVMTILGPVLMPWSVARDINEVGQVVGWSWMGEEHAFLWENGDVIDLGVVPGGFSSKATAVNNVGQVVGWGYVSHPTMQPGAPQAFLWQDGEMIVLGTLPDPDYDVCWALDINDVGQIVGHFGSSVIPNARAAFIWQDGVMTPLNDLIVPDQEAEIIEARAINDSGQVAGLGGFQGDLVGILLTPQQPIGDLNGDGTVGIVDFLMLLARWGPCADFNNCPADLDADCLVGISDFLILIANWG
jgi:probable HAF family extracellular repeat protein